MLYISVYSKYFTKSKSNITKKMKLFHNDIKYFIFINNQCRVFSSFEWWTKLNIVFYDDVFILQHVTVQLLKREWVIVV